MKFTYNFEEGPVPAHRHAYHMEEHVLRRILAQ